MTIIACEVSLHALPAGVPASAGPIGVPTSGGAGPWGRTFDDALAALGELPQLYTELDGSFVWTSLPSEERWQLFGCLYDRGTELAYVDLFGTCSQESLRQLFNAVRGDGPLMVQSRIGGTFCTEGEFVG
jgi:hypothetical protein